MPTAGRIMAKKFDLPLRTIVRFKNAHTGLKYMKDNGAWTKAGLRHEKKSAALGKSGLIYEKLDSFIAETTQLSRKSSGISAKEERLLSKIIKTPEDRKILAREVILKALEIFDSLKVPV